jgi:tripartite-type tricarboxylate transporter receptor subunit TctC
MKRLLVAYLLVFGAAGICREADAQSYPSRPIHVVVPFAAGGAVDTLARIIGAKLQDLVGQPVIVENRAGAGGTTGVASVARATPDGYTILVHSSTFAAAQAIYKKLPYDTLHDFTPIIPLGLQPTVLVVAPSKGWKTLADLVTAAKAAPGKLTFASAGIGAASHLAAERFRLSAGFDALHVPYKGPNEALTDVITGRVDFYFLPLAPALPLIRDHKLVALAVSSSHRNTALPDVPTTAEAGLKDASYNFWSGMFVPRETPKAIDDRLFEETGKALADASVRERLGKLGFEPMAMSSTEFDAYFREEVRSTVKLAKDVGIPQTQ